MSSMSDEVARALIKAHTEECLETRIENRNAFQEIRTILESRRSAASEQIRRIHDRLDRFTWWLIALLVTMLAGGASLAWYLRGLFETLPH